MDLLRRFRMYQLYHPPKMAAASTARPTPTPIPIFAPVDSPPPPPDLDASACVVGFDPSAEVSVYGDTIVAAFEVTMYEVTVVKPTTPSEVVGTTFVDAMVLVEKEVKVDEEVMTVEDGIVEDGIVEEPIDVC